MEIVLIFGGAAVLIAGLVYIGHQQQKKRTAAVSAVATQMGWGFEENPAVPPVLRGMEPFSSGHSHRVRNRVTRSRAGEQAAAFDFHYTTGGGKSAHHHSLAVAQVPLEAGLPQFGVRPEHFGHRIAGIFGMQDIDFPEYPVFSQKYLLRGPDEGSIRPVFGPPVIAFFEAHDGVGAACSGPELYIWQNKVAEPGQIETLMSVAMELRRRLTDDGKPGTGW